MKVTAMLQPLLIFLLPLPVHHQERHEFIEPAIIHPVFHRLDCELPFTQEEYNSQFGKIVCSAHNDFSDLKGEKRSDAQGVVHYQVNSISISGMSDIILSQQTSSAANVQELLKRGPAKPSGQITILFGCPDTKDLEGAKTLFANVATATEKIKPECVTLRPFEPGKDFKSDKDYILNNKSWTGNVYSSKYGNATLVVELSLMNLGSGFGVVSKVYMVQ